MISYSDTKVSVLDVVECNRSSVIFVYELIFLLRTSRSTENSGVEQCGTVVKVFDSAVKGSQFNSQ